MYRAQQTGANFRNAVLTLLVSLPLYACGGSDKINLNASGNVHDAVEAATGPLQDLNIKKRDIPKPLIVALSNPYAHPEPNKCEVVRSELATLDELLGPDLKPMSIELASADPGFLGIGGGEANADGTNFTDGVGDMAHEAVMGAIRSQTNIIPFRSIVRKITGADRYQKKVERAYEAGKLRRAYLKGYSEERFGKRCLSISLKQSGPLLPAEASKYSKNSDEK